MEVAVNNRDGLLYFIERIDTRQWYAGSGKWTNDPLKAKFFKSKELAQKHIEQETNPDLWSERDEELWYKESPFPECEITEHLFDF